MNLKFFLFRFFSLTYGLFSSMVFSFQVFGNFSFIFLVLIYSFILLWPENTLYDFNYSICWSLFHGTVYGWSGFIFYEPLKRTWILLLQDGDGWMASLTQWTWVWVSSRSWWWTGKTGVLQSLRSQRVRHDWATELNWVTSLYHYIWLFYRQHIARSCF